MIKLSYKNKIVEFNQNILKLSDSLKWIADARSSEVEQIPLLNCDDEVFEIFKNWFNELNKFEILNILNCDKTFTFNHLKFVKYDIKTLMKLLEFGFSNQIVLFQDTIALCLSLLTEVEKVNDAYFIKFKDTNIKTNFIYANMINNMKNLTTYEYDPYIIKNNCRYLTKEETEKGFKSEFNYELKQTILTEPKNFCGNVFALPNTVKIIGENLFRGDKIDYIKIPDSIRKIGHGAFFNCDIKNIVIPPYVKSIDECGFEYSKIENITFLGDKITLGRRCFYGCENLKKIKLPKRLRDISPELFECSGLEEIEFPKKLDTIQFYAFNDCNIKKLIIPPCPYLQSCVKGCKNLELVDFSNLKGKYIEIDDEGCDNLKTVIIPSNAKFVRYIKKLKSDVNVIKV